MTEEQWMTTGDYHAMLIHLRGNQTMPPVRTGLHCGAGYLAHGEAERVSNANSPTTKHRGIKLLRQGACFTRLVSRERPGSIICQEIGQIRLPASLNLAIPWRVPCCQRFYRNDLQGSTEEDQWLWGSQGFPIPFGCQPAVQFLKGFPRSCGRSSATPSAPSPSIPPGSPGATARFR
jgi:hypothetical protein